ncbi:MAG: carboxypeptidase-like regulatory domain-containing protein [Candidatus Cloacimonetes bacterium]|nr:carboxypeptidase-like regulatory domain-containing protein [Candidatus Cloacimonadota bacterium]
MRKWILILFVLIGLSVLNAKDGNGGFSGTVRDADTLFPLNVVNITIIDSDIGTSSSESGTYLIDNLQPGVYSLRFSRTGYAPVILANQIIKPNRILQVDAKLQRQAFILSGVQARKAEYFAEETNNQASKAGFSNEEIRRAPGAAGDISRMLTSLPAVGSAGGQNNNLVVRGGNPVENSFYVDGIQIPNISHYPGQGITGGPIGLLNIDFIKELSFYSGGFSAEYGDKLSSVSDITFRDGNKAGYDFQTSLDFIGYGLVGEGPITKSNGTFMIAVRRSYLDFLTKLVDLGTSSIPSYGDLQGKISWKPGNRHNLSILIVNGDDHSDSEREMAKNEKMLFYGNQDIYVNTVGINWNWMLCNYASTETTISWTSTKYKEDFYEPATGLSLLANHSHEQSAHLRNRTMFRLNESNILSLGIATDFNFDKIDNSYGDSIDPTGENVAGVAIKKNFASTVSGAFINYEFKTLDRMSVNAGIRSDYYQANDEITLSPRLSWRYRLFSETYLKGALGRYYQELPSVLLAQQSEDNSELMVSDHYIIGLEHILSPSLKISLEAYHKGYKQMPLDPDQPQLFILDEPFYDNGLYGLHENLVSEGVATSDGLELMLQKKMTNNFYGMLSGTYFRSRYKDFEGNWHNRSYDNRYFVSIQGGYRPNFNWEFSGKWTYSGGVPFTPLNVSESELSGQGVLDMSQVNEERYPAFHSLDLRIDKRFFYKNTSLVIYTSVWNVYNRKNIASYYWNPFTDKKDTIYNWGMLPVIGIEYEF